MACLGPGCAANAPDPGPQLVVGRPVDALGLDPGRISDSESAEVCEQIYDHLVRYAPGGTEIVPALASSWEVSHDGTVWLFHLRHGVRFHDGTPFDADAVVFNLDRQRDPRHPFHAGSPFPSEPMLRNVEQVERVDDHTVRVTIERAYAPFLANLAMFSVGMVSPTAVKRWGADYPFHPVGTGPFRFVEWSRGERITLAANPQYWGGAPTLRHLVFTVVRDSRQRLTALEGGAIDVAERLDPADTQFAALDPELKVDRVAGNNVGYLAMNTLHPPFDDERVRRAVNHAVDKAAIVKLVYQGTALPATGPLAPSAWGHVDLPGYAYDPARARRLLDEAGYRPDRPLKLYVMTASRPYLPSPERAARMIARNLADVGMRVEVVENPLEEHLRAVQDNQHDLCLLGWSGDNGDPDNFLYGLLDSDNAELGTAKNLSFFRDVRLHGLLRWAQESQDRAHRLAYYADAQKIIDDRAPWVPLAHAELVVARRADVAHLVLEPTALLHFQPVALERR